MKLVAQNTIEFPDKTINAGDTFDCPEKEGQRLIERGAAITQAEANKANTAVAESKTATPKAEKK